MLGLGRDTAPVPAMRGLGREVDPDPHLLHPELHACNRVLVHPDGRSVSVSWVRSVSQGLHSVVVDYQPDAVRVGVRLGTRPAFDGRSGYVVLRMIIEHAVVRLREPLRGRKLEVQLPGAVTGRH
jgi:hypothetical protein